MTFFYDLNKKLDGIREKPETTHKRLDERATGDYSAKKARAGKDIGKPGKNFEKIAKSAAERYGSKERGEKVAGAVLAKLRAKESVDEDMTDDKTAAQQALQALGQGNNQDMIKDLQRRAGVPQTGKVQPGQQPMSEDDMEEGNKFTGNLMKARAAGKKQADLDGDGDMEPVKESSKNKKPDDDNDGIPNWADKNPKKAGGDADRIEEAWDDMLKDVEQRGGQMKKGEKVQGHKGEIEKTDTGIKHTRRYDSKTGETDDGDEEKPAGEKRGRGRPKKTDKAPERVTAKAYKHKGGRKMSKEEIEEAIAALEEQGYSVEERKLTEPEMKKREEVVKSMKKNKGDFEKRYGKRGEEVMYATATKMAKKKAEEVEETTVAGSVAPSTAEAPKSKGKGGMTFGKGIYDSMNRELETMISESMNVSVNMSMDDHGEPRKNISVNADGEDAEQLAQLLNLAGVAATAHDQDVCPHCGETDCGCEQMVDENAPDWPTDTEVTGDDDPHLTRWAGGLNKPKETGQTTIPVVNRDPRRGSYGPAENPADLKETTDLGMKLYKEYSNYKAK